MPNEMLSLLTLVWRDALCFFFGHRWGPRPPWKVAGECVRCGELNREDLVAWYRQMVKRSSRS